MSEIRCTNCNALLFEVERSTVIIKGKSIIEIKPESRVKAKCKCGKINFVNVDRESNIFSGVHGIIV